MKSAVPHEFDRRAAQYERHATVQREAAARLAEWLPETIEGPALELGAGTGLFTKHLVGRAKQLEASDIAPNMVRAGQAVCAWATWMIADAGAPPEGRNYRWILSCSLVQWLADPVAAFRAWHRATATDARLLSGWFVSGTMNEFFEACPEASPFAWRDTEEWCDLLVKAGWSVRRRETKKIIRRYAGSTAMLREIHNAGAIIPRRLSPGKLRQALRDYERHHRDEDGVPATFEFLRLEAVRS